MDFKYAYVIEDVINNCRSGLDMDKLDYYQRDMKMTGVSGGKSTSHEFNRFIELARVMPADPIEYKIPSGESSQHNTPMKPYCLDKAVTPVHRHMVAIDYKLNYFYLYIM